MIRLKISLNSIIENGSTDQWLAIPRNAYRLSVINSVWNGYNCFKIRVQFNFWRVDERKARENKNCNGGGWYLWNCRDNRATERVLTGCFDELGYLGRVRWLVNCFKVNLGKFILDCSWCSRHFDYASGWSSLFNCNYIRRRALSANKWF